MNWSEKNRATFGNAVRKARQRMKMNQSELASQIALRTGGGFSQKKISDIECGKVKGHLDMEVLKAFHEILHLSDGEIALASPGSETVPRGWLSVSNQPHLLTNAYDELQSYLGKYYCVFRSTETVKDEFIFCDMDIFLSEDRTCDVKLELHVHDIGTTKDYYGKFFINDYYDVCYIILCGSKWREICMMIAPRFKPSAHSNKFFTPLVLTTSAGTTKRPTVHRMLISRKQLKGDALEFAKSQLMLNSNIIEFSETRLDALEAEIRRRLEADPDDEIYTMAQKFCNIIRNTGNKETVIRIEEAQLFDLEANGGTPESRAIATAMLRNYSNGVYHNKISKSGPAIFNTILDTLEK